MAVVAIKLRWLSLGHVCVNIISVKQMSLQIMNLPLLPIHYTFLIGNPKFLQLSNLLPKRSHNVCYSGLH
ncbi:unnamed protein product, partial [Staurois parvus]